MSKTIRLLVHSLFASVALLLVATPATTAQAKLHTETVSYKDGTTTLEGYLAYDDAGSAKKPGILVVHDWMGVTAETKRRAEMLAELGYVPRLRLISTARGFAPSTPKQRPRRPENGRVSDQNFALVRVQVSTICVHISASMQRTSWRLGTASVAR